MEGHGSGPLVDGVSRMEGLKVINEDRHLKKKWRAEHDSAAFATGHTREACNLTQGPRSDLIAESRRTLTVLFQLTYPLLSLASFSSPGSSV